MYRKRVGERERKRTWQTERTSISPEEANIHTFTPNRLPMGPTRKEEKEIEQNKDEIQHLILTSKCLENWFQSSIYVWHSLIR